MSYIAVIPARMASSRLPGKVLLDIDGKPMLQHTYERVKQSSASRVVIATDTEEVMKVAESFGAEVCMTLTSHPTGTDRLSEVCDKLGFNEDECVVNVQADEPMIDPAFIDKVADILVQNGNVSVGTLAAVIKDYHDLMNPNVVKLVMNDANEALYFSRAPIPWDRDRFVKDDNDGFSEGAYYRHIGLYGYRVGYLRQYVNTAPSDLENLEGLEQLRVLYQGNKIGVAVVEAKEYLEVNTQEDLERIRGYFASK